MTVAFSVCVYCGSRCGTDPAFGSAAAEVGTWIGQHNGQLVYGGGGAGLMRVVADATLAAGGRVVGVIPQSLVDREWAHHGCSELHIVQTMHDRKRMMAERADAFLALPGGLGTLEELFEVWTWRQLGYHDKPIGLLNVAGYYDRLREFLNVSVEQQLVGDWQMRLIRADNDPAALLQSLVDAAAISPAARLDEI
ncbi:MAG: TIGR00730 family Rossman fold protein [Rhodoferax sp.]|nr:TIGR00730 family Rossman fold protein [Rhodoferax sp.]MBK9237690.1 TIGR00730 family Rossman fold protein [Rhodoferax sp.]